MVEKFSVRQQAISLTEGLHPEHSAKGLRDVLLQISYRAHPGEHIPPYVLHIGQVDCITATGLSGATAQIQELGSLYANGHDIGRPFDNGVFHTRRGARLLSLFDFPPNIVLFTIAHHRWGLGIPLLVKDEFPSYVADALQHGKFDSLADAIGNKWSIAALMVLLADNSKYPKRPGSLENEILPFNRELAGKLIQIQIDRDRYKAGSPEHQAEIIGAEFVLALIPYLERKLGFVYAPDGTGNDIISRARLSWETEEKRLLAKWQQIHYDQTHANEKI